MTNFIIGTASFGNSYGVGNKGKTVSENHVRFIVDKANELGLKSFDTAPLIHLQRVYLGSTCQKVQKF